MNVKVLFFASLRDSAGTGEQEFDLEAGKSIAELWPQVSAGFELLPEKVLCAVNQEYVDTSYLLKEGDHEVAFFAGFDIAVTLQGFDRNPLDIKFAEFDLFVLVSVLFFLGWIFCVGWFRIFARVAAADEKCEECAGGNDGFQYFHGSIGLVF